MNGRALYNANSQLGESTINALKAQDEYVTINGKTTCTIHHMPKKNGKAVHCPMYMEVSIPL